MLDEHFQALIFDPYPHKQDKCRRAAKTAWRGYANRPFIRKKVGGALFWHAYKCYATNQCVDEKYVYKWWNMLAKYRETNWLSLFSVFSHCLRQRSATKRLISFVAVSFLWQATAADQTPRVRGASKIRADFQPHGPQYKENPWGDVSRCGR